MHDAAYAKHGVSCQSSFHSWECGHVSDSASLLDVGKET